MAANKLSSIYITITLVIILNIVTVTNTLKILRRIKDGEKVPQKNVKRYLVYIVKAEVSPRSYDHWICGGALITSEFIITSAACIKDIVYSYAIAGYEKYVTYKDLDKDKCTRRHKKKIVRSCIPKAYQLNYEKTEIWSNIDIGIAKVESPYVIDKTFSNKDYCNYAPSPIPINFDARYQQPGLDVQVYGWGHRSSWRMPGDECDYNQNTLHYGRSIIQPLSKCLSTYPSAMRHVINNYMICTDGLGNVNYTGKIMDMTHERWNGCAEGEGDTPDCSTRGHVESSHNNKVKKDCGRVVRPDIDKKIKIKSPGPCQNDHGGPLVAWIGTQEYLIGIASVFRVDKNWQCTGPYLFTSTHCTSNFIECTINPGYKDLRLQKLCSRPPIEKGFDIYERSISWIDHPDGAADNEKIAIRPQLPLYHAETK